jgi:hypothetical protein
MGFVNESSKLLTNKYFLYFIVFLASTNVLGYIVTNKINAIIFFILVSILTHQFSKNMAVILLVAIIATNFLMANKRMREGLEGIDKATSNNATSDKATSDKATSDNATSDKAKTTGLAQNVLQKITDIDPEIADAIPSVQNDQTTSPSLDPNNHDLNKTNTETNAPMGVGSSMSKKQSSKTSEHFGPRLDYAKTIEQSYQNLDQLLGSDSIQQLTSDTKKLMSQQQNLFNTMQQMAPMIEGAKNMLGGFDIKGLTNSLKKVSDISGISDITGK